MKLALCQLAVTRNKQDNVCRAREMLFEAAAAGADMAILPEMFCIAYVSRLFRDASEAIADGECRRMLSDCAKRGNIIIVGGSIPEIDKNKIYNTCMVFGRDGELMGTYRKSHLFDVDLPGFRFVESDTISKGDNMPLMIDAPIRTGVSICFDVRFPDWIRYTAEEGAGLLVLPAAFSQKTGPKHWELLLRARALDNQIFTAGVAPAASESSYGHSLLCSPDGEVLVDLGESENMAVVELDYEKIWEARRAIPIKG